MINKDGIIPIIQMNMYHNNSNNDIMISLSINPFGRCEIDVFVRLFVLLSSLIAPQREEEEEEGDGAEVRSDGQCTLHVRLCERTRCLRECVEQYLLQGRVFCLDLSMRVVIRFKRGRVTCRIEIHGVAKFKKVLFTPDGQREGGGFYSRWCRTSGLSVNDSQCR